MKKLMTNEIRCTIVLYKLIRTFLRENQQQTRRHAMFTKEVRAVVYQKMTEAGYTRQSIRKTIAEVK